MAALTKDRKTTRREAHMRNEGVSAGVVCRRGGIAVLNGGFAEPGTTATGLVAVGVFLETVDNTDGSDGDVNVEIENGPGAYVFDDAADVTPISKSDIGSLAYIVDDQTVSITATGRSVAGRIFDVDAEGVAIVFES